MSEELRELEQLLGARYRLEGEVGSGGMATVLRARDLKLQRDVAIKVLNPTFASTVSHERFRREIAYTAGLQHPNIVPVFDAGGDDETIFYIMPLVPGESLRARMRRTPQLPVAEALAIARDVGAALTYAHAHGIVHRDVKPENVLLSEGRAMVADFGIARALSSSASISITDLGVAIGTPAYMSPEQASGEEEVDARTDVYAMGCVVYEMLAGEPPFTGRTVQAVLARHLSERPPSLQVLRPTVTSALQLVVETALAKQPVDRFETPMAFVEALEAAQAPAVATRPAPSRRAWAVRALAGVAVLAVGAAVAQFVRRPPPADPNRVVVFPLAAPGAQVPNGEGEQVSLIIGSALEHTEPLRWLDGQSMARVASDVVLPNDEAARLARAAGARFFLNGALVHDRDSLVVIVRLHDAVADSLVRQESVSGKADSVSAAQLALRAITRILPQLLPTNGRVDLSYLADRHPASIADWLQGEREYARSSYVAALQHMNRALARDSSMGVAALKGAQAAAHLEDYAAARQLIDVALRLDRQLPRHHLALARGLQRYLAGDADSAITAFRAARAADTTWSEPWMWLGETYHHLMPSADSLEARAESHFEGAVRLNPAFAPALFHLMDFAVRRGDLTKARALLARFDGVSPDSGWKVQARLTVQCAAEGPDRIDWRGAVGAASDRMANVARILGSGGRYPACARRALESTLAYDTISGQEHFIYRWSALKGLTYQAFAEGRESAMLALLDSAQRHGMPAAVSLHVLGAAAGSRGSEAHADSAIRSLMTTPISVMEVSRLRYLALWSWHTRDTTRLDSVSRRLGVIADSTGTASHQLARQSAEARLALLRGDSATARRLLASLRPGAAVGMITWDPWEAAAGERLLLSRLQLASGEARAALATAEFFDSPQAQIHLLYLPASLEVRRQAAESLGDRARRDDYTRRLRSLTRGGAR